MIKAEPSPQMQIIAGYQELAGWVADITFIFVYNERRDPAAEKWMKKRAVRNYYDALEKPLLFDGR